MAEVHDLAKVSLEQNDDAFADVVGLHVNPFDKLAALLRGIWPQPRHSKPHGESL
jgi:hypothetical protein